MRKGIIIGGKVALAAFLFVLAANAFAQATVGVDLAYKSRYLFRGLPWNTESVFWPDIWVTSNGVTVTMFGSVNLTNSLGNKNKISELDYYLDYTRAFGKVNASIGWAQYTYPNTIYPNTGELYLKVGSDFKILVASLAGYFDLQEAKGVYINPKVSRAFTCAALPGLTSTLAVSLGYGDKKHNLYWFGLEKAGLTDLTPNLNLSYALPGKIGKWLAVSGEVGYSRIMTKEIADRFVAANMPDGKDHRGNFWFGLALNATTSLATSGGAK